MKVVKRYKLPVIRQISTRDVMYNIMNITNAAVCYITKTFFVKKVICSV